MTEKTTEVAQEDSATNTPEVSEGIDAPAASSSEVEEQPVVADTESSPPPSETPPSDPEPTAAASAEAAPANEPDALDPFINKAFETIQHEVEIAELNQFLRGHIKTFREQWDELSDAAKDVYVHMMASQLLQRKAASTRIMNYEAFKLPIPSAQTTLFESIKQSQVKPQKRRPVLLMPPNLRPTYSLKK
jgi:hypothetical protein